MPPLLEVFLGTTLEVASPGTILGSVHLFDEDGLFSLELHVFTPDSAFAEDSLIVLQGDVEMNRGINWDVPPGLPNGTLVRVAATVSDFAGFVAADTVLLTVQNGP